MAWGILNYRMNLAETLRDSGFEIIMLAADDQHRHSIEARGFSFFSVPLLRHGTSLIQELTLLFLIFRRLQQIKPDYVLSFTIKPNFYSALLHFFFDFHLICNITGLGSVFESSKVKHVALQKLVKFVLLRADYIFFQNPSDASTYCDGTKFDNYSITHGSGVDLEKFAYRPFFNPIKCRRFVLISRIVASKGIFEFCAASKILSKKYPNWEFEIWGPLENNVRLGLTKKELIEALRDSPVRYMGPTDKTEQVLDTADFVVLPTSYNEGSPKILIEAAAAGKPVVATTMPGCVHTVVDGVTGFLCAPKNPEDLAKKMSKLATMPIKDLKKMSKMSRERAENLFSSKILFDQYLRVISELKRN